MNRPVDHRTDLYSLGIIFCTMLMCDIDHFKKYNDTYGHQKGDACIRFAAEAVEKSLGRTADVAARYGGEEFIVILPKTDIKGAQTIAERIIKNPADEKIPHSSSETKPIVSLSIGFASIIPTNGTDPEDLVKQADQALYMSKKNGRDRFSVYTTPSKRGCS